LHRNAKSFFHAMVASSDEWPGDGGRSAKAARKTSKEDQEALSASAASNVAALASRLAALRKSRQARNRSDISAAFVRLSVSWYTVIRPR